MTRLTAPRWGTALALALVLLAGDKAVASDDQPASPHGQPSACGDCHQPTTAGALPQAIQFRDGSPDASCKRCHTEDPHQIGLLPKRTKIPPKMLLVDGRLACLTCHDEPACEGKPVDPAAPYFFRGGPYEHEGQLCAQCHQVKGDRFNPHAAMAAAPTDPTTCEHCHVDPPAPDATEADLKVSGPNICHGCHMETLHAGIIAHTGVAPGAIATRAHKAGLPLTDTNEIVCVTCHDPHPVGTTTVADARRSIIGTPVLPKGWQKDVLTPALADRAADIGVPLQAESSEPDLLRLPLRDGELCRACHRPAAIDAARRSER
ncbi:MAG: hypothetical protein GXP62_17060 [Oligoflexia bacterium]|nr:hypothetical protein [Oligoflexia bacterium]